MTEALRGAEVAPVSDEQFALELAALAVKAGALIELMRADVAGLAAAHGDLVRALMFPGLDEDLQRAERAAEWAREASAAAEQARAHLERRHAGQTH